LVKKAKNRFKSPFRGEILKMDRKLLKLLIQGFAPKGACLICHSFIFYQDFTPKGVFKFQLGIAELKIIDNITN
jgi:hypothetical protein